MPLINSSSTIARNKNIKKEISAGKPIKQAVAIGYAKQRSTKKTNAKPTLADVKAERAVAANAS